MSSFTLNDFVLKVTPELFLQYCKENDIPIKVKSDLSEDDARDKILNQILKLEDSAKQKLEQGLFEINILTPNEGSHFLIEECKTKKIDLPEDELENYNSHDKALWFYLNHKDTFREVAAWQEVNDTNGWKKLVNLPKVAFKAATGKEDALRQRLSDYLMSTELRGKNCKVFCYKQKNRVCYVAYPEGYTQTAVVFVKGNLRRRHPHKPAEKIFFLYYPKKGKLSTKAQGGWKKIKEYQKIFGLTVIGEEINVDSDRVFNLDILKNKSISFPTPPEDEIKYVKVKALNIRYFGGQKKVRLEVNGDNEGIEDLHDLMDELRINPGYISISKAEFQIKFPTDIKHSSGTLTFYVSWPNTHNINDNPRYTKAEGYLKKWGLEKDFEEILDKVFDPEAIELATTFELDKTLTSSVRYWLRDNKIIFEDKYLKEWFCDNCNTSHTINTQGRKRFYVCGGERIFLSRYDTQLWKFDYQRLIKCLAESLDLSSPAKEFVPDKVWQVGRINNSSHTISVYYNKEATVPENITTDSVIINPNETKHVSDSVLLLSLGEFMNLTAKGLSIEKDYFEQIVASKFSPVIFKENGDLIVNGKVVVTLTPTTPEYYFLKYLWDNFDESQDHLSIHKHCGKQLAKSQGFAKWQDNATEQEFCNKMKSSIKSKAKTTGNKKLVDQVIQSTRTTDRKNAYRLTNPQ